LALRLVDVASESALKTYLTESRDGLNRMAQIIGELLSFSRFTDGEMDERSVNAVVEEAVRTLAAALDAHRIAVAVDFQHQEMPMVRGSRLYQVCCNLIKNAIDAMPNGGRLCITTGLVQDHVILRVADTGIGLPKEVDRLFEAFYTTKPAGKGTGLGLAICKTYVENMKGTLQAEPGREQGAVFTVRIPLRSFHRPRSESAGMVLDLTARPGASPPRATAKSEGRPSNDD
jgi:signal transduction histidine kinase